AATLHRGYTDPERDSASEWWGNTDSTGAYHASNRVPKMERDAGGITQDNNGFKKEGASSYRKTYSSSDGHDLRMPSKASINRMAKTVTPGAPFDVPFEYSDAKGKTQAGWMRMRKSADGTWSADALGEEGYGRRVGSSVPPRWRLRRSKAGVRPRSARTAGSCRRKTSPPATMIASRNDWRASSAPRSSPASSPPLITATSAAR